MKFTKATPETIARLRKPSAKRMTRPHKQAQIDSGYAKLSRFFAKRGIVLGQVL